MNLKQFKYVLVLSSEGSFGKAADALNISQPSLSQYIKNIENQLGVELFDRASGSVRLTEAGQIYIDFGKRILDLEHQMYGRLNDLAEHKSGSVIVGTSPYRSAGMMPILSKKLQEIYPGMHIAVEEMTSGELLDAAERGQFDLCLTMLPVNERVFSFEKIAEEELILAVPGSFKEFDARIIKDRKYPAVDVSLMDNQAFVMITEGQLMQRCLDDMCYDFKLNIRKAAVVKSLEAQIAMVREGVGLALVPSGIERFCSRDEVRFYSFVQDFPKRQVAAIWKKDKPLNQATVTLLNLIKEINW